MRPLRELSSHNLESWLALSQDFLSRSRWYLDVLVCHARTRATASIERAVSYFHFHFIKPAEVRGFWGFGVLGFWRWRS